MKNYLLMLLASISILFGAFIVPASAQLSGGTANTQDFQNSFDTTFDQSSDNLEETLPAQVGRLIQLFVSFAGVLMLVIIVYAGILWMTAGGNESNVDKAKKLMQNAVIGLVIVMLAFVLVVFINGVIRNAGFGQ